MLYLFVHQFWLDHLSNMIIVARYLIFLEFLSRIMIVVSNPSTEPWRPNSTGRLRRIPGENITWMDQREDDYLYADKSVYLERLLKNNQSNIFFYITRPRRFGKSSFLTMAKYFFDGDKMLFKGLKINDRGNTYFFKKRSGHGVPKELKRKKWIQCPVIYLDFRKIKKFNNMIGFQNSYTQRLRDIAESYGLNCSVERVPDMDISHLIFKLEFKFKLRVVVLVDEYDSPIQAALENLKNRALAEEIRQFFDNLFGAIKSDAEKLRLVLVLGVSRLGSTNLQSGPNNYVDLTYEKEFAGAFGFTSEEMIDFLPEIADQFNLNSKKGIDEFLSNLRKEYDGYNFTFQYDDGKKTNVLNPVSTMKCLQEKEFGCYWSDTSNINEVIRKLYFAKIPLKALEHSKLSKDDIKKRRNPAFEIIPLEILMLVYGYLTIESYNNTTKEVVLNFPNNEIRVALQQNINNYKLSMDTFLSEECSWLLELKWHMETGHLEGTMNTLKNMFNIQFSKTIQQGMNEFSNTAWLMEKLKMAGIPYQESMEFKTENGKKEGGDVDIFTEHLKKNFIMSIKHGKPGINAVQALIDYLQENPTTFLQTIGSPAEAWFVGISFDSRKYGEMLHDWIGISFKNGALLFDQCKASLPGLCDKLKSRKNATQS